MPEIKAVFFDLDGTLLDTLEDLADAGNLALAARGFPSHPVDAYRFFVGDGMETLMRRAAPPDTDEASLDLLTKAMREQYGRNWARKTRPYAGIVAMLEWLASRSMPMAVLSNKPHEFTLLTVERFFPRTPFALVQGSPEGGRAKPEPAMALSMAKSLGLAPAEVLFMGDSRTDMDTAVAAGMLPAGVLWGFRPKSELLAHGARVLLEEPADLFNYI